MRGQGDTGLTVGRFPVCIAATLGDSDSDKIGMNLFKKSISGL